MIRLTTEDPRTTAGQLLIAELSAELGAVRPTEAIHTAEIKPMYVRRSVRGRKISRQILLKLEELARSFEYHSIKLETGLLQPEAMGLYESADDPMSVCYEKLL